MKMSELAVIFDNHVHLSKNGRYLEAINEFKKYGGTHLNFCPYTDIKKILKNESYTECYEDGLKLAKYAMEKTGVKIFLTVGPYPIDYLKLKEVVGREKAIAIMKKGMEEAQQFCMEEKAIAIGEIGRPHFKVDEQTWKDSNEIMEYGMMLAKEANIPVILHMEKATPSNMKEIAEMANKIGLKKDKVIKHYSPPFIKSEENYGIFPSVIAKEENIKEALKKGLRFMLETDYLDDLKRPGAVLDLKTIPRKLNKLLQQEIMNEEQAIVINKDNPEEIYGISLE
jgi:TatD-related deoxyribonuclease